MTCFSTAISSSQENIQELSAFLLGGVSYEIHLIGVAGSGMSGLAGLLLSIGHRVSGSDRVTSEEVERLCTRGLKFFMGHRSEDAASADVIVYSSAIRAGNPTFDRALELGKRLVRRAEVLSALMIGKKGIVISGMHGKTTTSSLAAHVFGTAGLNPSHYVGAEIPILGTNARWSAEGDYFIAEGDESDGTLVHYEPEHAVILNIEPEHLDFYKNIEAIDAVYQRLIDQTKGSLFYWAEDPGAKRLCAGHPCAIAVGVTLECTYRYESLKQENGSSSFVVIAKNRPLGRLELSIPGAHNVSNAMIVIALALELGVPFDKIVEALKEFRGAKRRFELKYKNEHLTVVDDYGHHPTEIAATLATARSQLNKKGRLFVLFQPHRYSRTVAFEKEFGKVLLDADTVFVTDIYPASEEAIPGVSGESIVKRAQELGHSSIFYEPQLEGLRSKFFQQLKPDDLLLSLGAGNIHEETARLIEDLKKRDYLLSIMGAGRISLYEPLSAHTTMRVGGPAQFWAEPETEEGFAALVKICMEENIPLMVMGRGSNLLVRDGGIPGVVVHLAKGSFAHYTVEGETIHAGVGVKLKQLTAAARQINLSGFEWMEGIPGNVGGALRMNAGAMGDQMFDQVLAFRYVTQKGEIKEWNIHQAEPFFGIHYRDIPFFKTHYALSALLKGTPAPKIQIDTIMEASKKHRRETQPIAASAGCTFKNPPLNSTVAAKSSVASVLTSSSMSLYTPRLRADAPCSSSATANLKVDFTNTNSNTTVAAKSSVGPTAPSEVSLQHNKTISAGRLIEELGLKNHTVGKARVSEVHGNFIVNDGGATANEVLQLIDEIKSVAWKKRGMLLETEVQIVGVDKPKFHH
ncbi:MAG: UDP-N-acetylmuramate--L-alanine ligase [Verrucomicrobiae bacterium]|nr:UDP-N-acetylmuramate--L-alanine ligase [Verrucomicrobiae bacterium]